MNPVVRVRALATVLAALTLLLFVLAPSRALAAPTTLRRVAIVIGANDPAPGRAPLRFAHDDARLVADTLERVGRFAKNDVRVLLEPTPEDVVAALTTVASEIAAAPDAETMFVFYYSGHSDGQSLYPHGKPLAIADVRERVAKLAARIRIGILDTCRGGSWTQSKGLSVGPPLDASDLIAVASEGTALVSSSSGFENAHEAEAVHGSFFTHYFTAGLLGAADKSGDGSITLQEAFEYARERTVRDSAKLAPAPQHPSFDLKLRGRQDIVLAQIAASASSLEVTQTRGPLEVIHLASGVTVAELPSGPRTLRLALPPGRYLVRRVEDGKTYTREIEVPAGATTTLAEGQLDATGDARLSMKGESEEPDPIPTHTTLPRNWGEWTAAFGVTTSAVAKGAVAGSGDPSAAGERMDRSVLFYNDLAFGFTDRFQCDLIAPLCAYRFGERGGLEVVPFAGLTSIGYSSLAGLLGTVDAGVGLRAWTGRLQSVNATLSASSGFTTNARQVIGNETFGAFSRWAPRATLGYSWTLARAVTLNLGVSGTVPLRVGGGRLYPAILGFGSVQAMGGRTAPLIQLHVSRRFSIDLRAEGYVNLSDGSWRDQYLGGFTYNF